MMGRRHSPRAGATDRSTDPIILLKPESFRSCSAWHVAHCSGRHGGIHPRNKTEIGRRLALSYAKVGLGLEVTATGPEFQSAAIVGNSVSLKFTNTVRAKIHGLLLLRHFLHCGGWGS